jgi:hypothetical protein
MSYKGAYCSYHVLVVCALILLLLLMWFRPVSSYQRMLRMGQGQDATIKVITELTADGRVIDVDTDMDAGVVARARAMHASISDRSKAFAKYALMTQRTRQQVQASPQRFVKPRPPITGHKYRPAAKEEAAEDAGEDEQGELRSSDVELRSSVKPSASNPFIHVKLHANYNCDEDITLIATYGTNLCLGIDSSSIKARSAMIQYDAKSAILKQVFYSDDECEEEMSTVGTEELLGGIVVSAVLGKGCIAGVELAMSSNFSVPNADGTQYA